MATAPADERLSGGAMSNGKPVLRDRYLIDPASPLPELDLPNAGAFLVTDRRDPAREMYALVCRPEITPRIKEMRSLRGLSSVGLLPLLEWGVVEWPPLDCRTIAVIYQRPKGGKFVRGLSETVSPTDPLSARDTIITPLYAALRLLASNNVVHRAIRPDNLYFLDEKRTQLVLGDCVTTPPAYDQHALFETIGSAMTPRAGRGRGDFHNDMYSLGATVMFMIAGQNSAPTSDEREVIASKVTATSFRTLVGEIPLNDTMLELVRGLLADETSEIWNLEKIDLWLSGKRATPVQMKRPKKAKTALMFAGMSITHKRLLAQALALNWDTAASIAREGQIEVWLRHSLEDKETAERIGGAVRDATADELGSGMDDNVLIFRICLLLDPAGPIRYRDFIAMPDGFGTALEQNPSLGQYYAELIKKEIVRFWTEAQPVYMPDQSLHLEISKNMDQHVRQTGMGAGIERCIYELNGVAPCRSPLIERDYVLDIADILPALDRASKRVDRTTLPVDRHITAFVKSRFDHNIDKQVEALTEGNKERATLGMISLLAMLQWRLGPETVFGLSSWVGGIAQPAINSYHSRSQRKRLERDIPKMVRRGSLPEIYNLLEDKEQRDTDTSGYAEAVEEFREAQAEAIEIDTGEDRRKIEAKLYGQQTAAAISLLIGMTALTLLFFGRMF